jgi:hypothetical protein
VLNPVPIFFFRLIHRDAVAFFKAARFPDQRNARCLSIGDKVTLSGKVFQNTATDYSGDGGFPGQKYIAVLLDKPICYAEDAPGMTETTVQGYQKITAKWVGRHVVITGHVDENEGPSVIIDNVRER